MGPTRTLSGDYATRRRQQASRHGPPVPYRPLKITLRLMLEILAMLAIALVAGW